MSNNCGNDFCDFWFSARALLAKPQPHKSAQFLHVLASLVHWTLINIYNIIYTSLATIFVSESVTKSASIFNVRRAIALTANHIVPYTAYIIIIIGGGDTDTEYNIDIINFTMPPPNETSNTSASSAPSAAAATAAAEPHPLRYNVDGKVLIPPTTLPTGDKDFDQAWADSNQHVLHAFTADSATTRYGLTGSVDIGKMARDKLTEIAKDKLIKEVDRRLAANGWKDSGNQSFGVTKQFKPMFQNMTDQFEADPIGTLVLLYKAVVLAWESDEWKSEAIKEFLTIFPRITFHQATYGTGKSKHCFFNICGAQAARSIQTSFQKACDAVFKCSIRTKKFEGRSDVDGVTWAELPIDKVDRKSLRATGKVFVRYIGNSILTNQLRYNNCMAELLKAALDLNYGTKRVCDDLLSMTKSPAPVPELPAASSLLDTGDIDNLAYNEGMAKEIDDYVASLKVYPMAAQEKEAAVRSVSHAHARASAGVNYEMVQQDQIRTAIEASMAETHKQLVTDAQPRGSAGVNSDIVEQRQVRMATHASITESQNHLSRLYDARYLHDFGRDLQHVDDGTINNFEDRHFTAAVKTSFEQKKLSNPSDKQIQDAERSAESASYTLDANDTAARKQKEEERKHKEDEAESAKQLTAARKQKEKEEEKAAADLTRKVWLEQRKMEREAVAEQKQKEEEEEEEEAEAELARKEEEAVAEQKQKEEKVADELARMKKEEDAARKEMHEEERKRKEEVANNFINDMVQPLNANSATGQRKEAVREASKADKIKPSLGEVGYTFWKKFHGEWYCGEVVEIFNRNGKNRRCNYTDGDTEDVSMAELKKLAKLEEQWLSKKRKLGSDSKKKNRTIAAPTQKKKKKKTTAPTKEIPSNIMLWSCTNAENRANKCLHTVCDTCYKKKTEPTSTRRGGKKEKSNGREVPTNVPRDECGHNHALKITFQKADMRYITGSHAQKIRDNAESYEKFLPTNCKDCGGKFV